MCACQMKAMSSVCGAVPVDGIANNGMPKGCSVSPDLMRSAGAKTPFHEASGAVNPPRS